MKENDFNDNWKLENKQCPFQHIIKEQVPNDPIIPLQEYAFGEEEPVEVKGCKLYGHRCPGGEEQEKKCETSGYHSWYPDTFFKNEVKKIVV